MVKTKNGAMLKGYQRDYLFIEWLRIPSHPDTIQLIDKNKCEGEIWDVPSLLYYAILSTYQARRWFAWQGRGCNKPQ